ncbi:transposable element Tcb2 transposase [Trichonephila clavipes]|nr:transposable element Tcb2 transposase [Trichonephila clavipes]
MTVWGAIVYNSWSPLVLIRGTMTARRYDHDILQPHVLPLMQQLPGAIFIKTMFGLTRPYYPSLACPIPRFVQSSISGINLVRRVGHPTSLSELEARLQQIWNGNVSRHHTELVCPIVLHRAFALEGIQQGIKSSVLLPFSLK